MSDYQSAALEAQRLVHGDRNNDYGHPLDDFTKTARMWSVVFGHEVTAEQVGLCMVLVKVSRHLNREKFDNLVDMAGYAETINMIAHERKRRANADNDKQPDDINPRAVRKRVV